MPRESLTRFQRMVDPPPNPFHFALWWALEQPQGPSSSERERERERERESEREREREKERERESERERDAWSVPSRIPYVVNKELKKAKSDFASSAWSPPPP